MIKSKENKIDYLEIPIKDIETTQSFFRAVFAWEFHDFGPHYCTFNNAGLMGGFTVAECGFNPLKGAPLIVIYRHDLDKTMAEITQAGGKITKHPFSFPGGRRFHFTDPSDNEFAVWSEE